MDYKLHDLQNSLTVSQIANVHFFNFPKNYVTKGEKHPFFELIYVSSGALEVTSEEYNGLLYKNDFIIHSPNTLHSLSCKKNEQTTVIIIGFVSNLTNPNYFAKKPLQLDENEVKDLAKIVKEGRNVFAPPYDVPLYVMNKKNHQTYGSEQLLKLYLEALLIRLIRKYEYLVKTNEHDGGFEIDQIVKYVNANFNQKISIAQLSFLFRTNRSSLCKAFKQATNKTLVQYVTDKKIDFIKRELICKDKTIKEISDLTGFTSIPNFYAFFKKHVGVTPIEFKKEN